VTEHAEFAAEGVVDARAPSTVFKSSAKDLDLSSLKLKFEVITFE
jgi:hypothetical protein